MTVVDAVVVLQMATFLTLAVAFALSGKVPLAVAQGCYAIATAALFYGKV